MRSKKTQVTMFIIMGIVLLFVFVVLFYLKNVIQQESIEQNIEDINRVLGEQGKYHQYVQGCVEQATKEGLFMLGMQGGTLYDYQVNGGKAISKSIDPYGISYIPFEYEGEVYNVSYGIKNPELGSEFHPVIPFYPYGLTKLISNPKLINRYFKNSYGNYPRNPFTPLCNFHGTNKRGISEAVACETYDSRNVNDLNSIQEYLERYIENKTMSCVRLKDLPELSDMDITKGNITANVTFGENHVLVSMILPIHIKVGSYNSVIQLNNFGTVYSVRLKKIHELVSHLIENDVNNIFFNIVNDAPAVNDCKDITGGNALCLKPGMDISKISNVCFENGLCTVGEYDDILVVKDYDNLLDGLPYVFTVAIQNRPPALDLIRKEVGTGSFYFDYVVSVDEKIMIEPIGFDPDEDQHNFNGFMDDIYYYYNWKENYDDIFLCPSNNCLYTDETKIQHIYTTSPKNWTTSQNYIDTKRVASYTTNEDDKGIHVLKVEVCDEGGLCDYQAVIIYVVNGSFVGGYNPYNDIPSGFTSLEDPYEFTSPMDENTYPGITLRYKWTINDETNTLAWTGQTTQPKLSVPINPAFTINNIKTGINEFFTSPEKYSLKVDLYNDLNNNLVSGGSFDNFVDVKECLPHRSFDPSYPYNLGIDPFDGNHSCCIGDPADPTQANWGTIKSSSEVCYTEIEYGCREDTNFGPTVGFSPTLCSNPNIFCDDGGRGISNLDIYERKFERNCDGLRGNTCEGSMEETRTNIKQCGECQQCQYGGINEPNCLPIDYTEGIICNPIFECSLGEGHPYSGNIDPYPYKCQGTCNNNECNTSINCKCDKFCGAECEFNDEESYIWEDKECIHDCNNFDDLNNLKFDCKFYDTDNTICSSPNPGLSLTDLTVDGVDYKIGISDPIYTNSIDSKNPFYVSYCNSGDYCIYAVTCNGEGPSAEIGDYCPSPGVEAIIFDILNNEKYNCYYGTSGTDLGCDLNGGCTDADSWSIICDEGNPIDDGYCREDDVCNVPSCNSVTGWDNVQHTKIDLGGTDYDATNGGSQMDSGNCYYDMECQSSGWTASSESCSGSYQDGNFCYYNPSCGSSGCDYDKELCNPGSHSSSSTCYMGNDCTASGCISRGSEIIPDPCVDSICTVDGWECS
jgi:hypothetical protein